MNPEQLKQHINDQSALIKTADYDEVINIMYSATMRKYVLSVKTPLYTGDTRVQSFTNEQQPYVDSAMALMFEAFSYSDPPLSKRIIDYSLKRTPINTAYLRQIGLSYSENAFDLTLEKNPFYEFWARIKTGRILPHQEPERLYRSFGAATALAIVDAHREIYANFPAAMAVLEAIYNIAGDQGMALATRDGNNRLVRNVKDGKAATAIPDLMPKGGHYYEVFPPQPFVRTRSEDINGPDNVTKCPARQMVMKSLQPHIVDAAKQLTDILKANGTAYAVDYNIDYMNSFTERSFFVNKQALLRQVQFHKRLLT